MTRKSVDALAREHNEGAISVLSQIMRDEFAKDADRIKAADSILDRGNGKPLTASIQIPASRAQAARLVAMTDDELLDMVQAQPLPRLSHDPTPLDAEFTVAGERDPLLD